MSSFHFRREHQLGLAQMRKLARPWIGSLERKFALQTIVVKGKTSDVVKFSRAGLDGEVVIASDHIELTAQLGFLFAAFGSMIGSEMEKNLDAFMKEAEGAAVAVPPPSADGASSKPIVAKPRSRSKAAGS